MLRPTLRYTLRRSCFVAVSGGLLLIAAMLCRPARAQPAAGAAGAGGAEPLPTQQDIQAKLDAGQFQDVIKEAQRAIAMKGEAAKQFDRGALFAMKGEAHLRLKQSAPAAEAFTQAAKESSGAAGDDVDKY